MSKSYLSVIVCNNIQNPALITVHILITVYADVHRCNHVQCIIRILQHLSLEGQGLSYCLSIKYSSAYSLLFCMYFSVDALRILEG
jgi:hypothetical protein